METPKTICDDYIEQKTQRTISEIECHETILERLEVQLIKLNKIKNYEEIDDDVFVGRLHNNVVYNKYKNQFKNILVRDKVQVKIEKILFNMKLKNKIAEYLSDYYFKVNMDGEYYSNYIENEEEYLKYLLNHKVEHDIIILPFIMPAI